MLVGKREACSDVLESPMRVMKAPGVINPQEPTTQAFYVSEKMGFVTREVASNTSLSAHESIRQRS